jgi:glycosyltransferase involved in cell wall biosynthesis
MLPPNIDGESLNVWLVRDGLPLGYGVLLARAFQKKHSVVEIITDGWNERLTLQVKAGRTLRFLCRSLTRLGVRIDKEFAKGLIDISTDRNHRPHPISPDLIIVTESAVRAKFDLSKFHVPTAFVVIDPYIGFEEHIREADVQSYDYVFVSQRECVDRYREAGCKNVEWLPFACDPELHGRVEVPSRYTVASVGAIHPKWGAERKRLIELISKNFEDCWFGRSFGHQMAYIYSSSKMIFNKSILNELNMRVFEALASGSMLVTDRIQNGLTELFPEGKDLECYSSDEELISKLNYYLRNATERETIATHGRQTVMEQHTYDHRAQQIITRMLS